MQAMTILRRCRTAKEDLKRLALQLERRYLPAGWDAWNNLQTNGLLLDDEKRRAFGEAGRELVKPRFDWHTMSDTLIAEYTKYLELKKKGLPMP